MDDAAILLRWRNDPETRAQSLDSNEIGRVDHLAWLRRILADDSCDLYIAELAGAPVGTVRADRCERVTELSWTVAPESRGKGIGEAMVALAVSQIEGPLVARIKKGNQASMKIAEAVGLRFSREHRGLLVYDR